MSLINGRTQVCGILGYPVGHSFSPAMQNAAFAKLGMNWTYVPFPVKPGDLPAAVEAIRSLNLAGVNVTVPHKQQAALLVDELSPNARLTGAINTIVHSEGVLQGHNTDGEGFVKALEEEAGMVPGQGAVVIIGAGGAARAVSVALALSGAPEMFISNRAVEKAEGLANLINGHTVCRASVVNWLGSEKIRVSQRAAWSEILKKTSLVIQTTPVGMHPREDEIPPFPYELLGPEHTVVDLIYNPVHTGFMEAARLAGARVFNGISMLLHQGAISFQLWTQAEPPLEEMRKALELEILAMGNKR